MTMRRWVERRSRRKVISSYQVLMGLLSLWEASSVSLSPSSQMWRVNLVKPSSPTDWKEKNPVKELG